MAGLPSTQMSMGWHTQFLTRGTLENTYCESPSIFSLSTCLWYSMDLVVAAFKSASQSSVDGFCMVRWVFVGRSESGCLDGLVLDAMVTVWWFWFLKWSGYRVISRILGSKELRVECGCMVWRARLFISGKALALYRIVSVSNHVACVICFVYIHEK